MDSPLLHRLDTHRAWFAAMARTHRVLLFALLLFALLCTAAYCLRPSSLPDLAEGNLLTKSHFYTRWQQGELVVVMRHVERCDHSTNPCYAQADGITGKGQRIAAQMGQALHAMNISQADVYNSPMLRTDQTAAFVFGRNSTDQAWLKNCRNTLLGDVLAHKLDGRNLFLVTHSECLGALETALNVPDASSLDYGASLVVAVNPKDHSTKVLGYIDAPGWAKILARRP